MMAPLWTAPFEEEERTSLFSDHITTILALNSWESTDSLATSR